MIRFIATIQGDRGEVSRQENHNITGHIRGQDVGVFIHGFKTGDRDVFNIFTTKGNNYPTNNISLGSVQLNDEGMPVFNPSVSSKAIKALMECTDCIDEYITRNPKDIKTKELRNEIEIIIAEAVE